jgi:hypothetical protein
VTGLFRRGRRAGLSGPRRNWLIAGGFIAIGLVIVGAFAALRLASIARDLRKARTLIESASTDVEQGRLGPARGALSEAQTILVRANGDLYGQPELELVGWLPAVGENLDSLQQSVSVALQLVDGGSRLLAITQPLEDSAGKLEVSLHKGAIPLQPVIDVQRVAQELAQVLPAKAEEPSKRHLVGAIADLQDRIFEQAGRRRTQLDNVSRALSILTDMSGGNGPRRYLIAVANTAEMRGAGGMILSYGVLQSENGTFTLGDFGPIDDIALDFPLATPVTIPPDYLARWQGLEPTRLWRNTTMSPDFQLAAPIMAAMFQQRTELPVNGVIQIDPAGLAAMLEGTGPVEVPTVGLVSAADVVDLTINRAYIDFPNRDQRQEVSADVAKATFQALIDGDFGSLRPFGTALFKAAAARHLIFSTSVPNVADQVRFFGADGALTDPAHQDAAVLTVQNVGKNKLDYYVDTSLALSGNRPAGAAGSITAAVTVTNSTPEGISSEYVTGPSVRGLPYALYRGIVSLYVPTGTTVAGAEGSDSPPSVTTEGGRTVVTYDISLPAGETSTVTLQLNLVPRAPGRPYSVIVIPVGRVRPTTVSVDIALGDGRRAQVGPVALEQVTIVLPRAA